MRQEDREAAAAAIVEGERVVSNLATPHQRLKPCFARARPHDQAGKYIAALMSDLPRKNGWTIAEHTGDATPDPTQRLLNHAVWDHEQAMGVVRGFVAEHLADQPLVIAALDESGQEKTGQATAGVQRRYMGCAGRIANGVNTVYRSHATPGGHALVGARIYVPADQLADQARRAASGIGARADDLVARHVGPDAWQVCSVAGSKGERRYARAWIATTSPRHHPLIRRHLATGDLAFHYCFAPEGRPVTVMTLVRVACPRWPVEEGFEFGKDHFGLDHSQVRLHTALFRHIVLTLAALAVCAVTAAQAKARTPAAIPPATPDERPPEDPGLIALTVAEVKRLFMLVTRRVLPEVHHLCWVWWRRRHQARARWFHHRARLRR